MKITAFLVFVTVLVATAGLSSGFVNFRTNKAMGLKGVTCAVCTVIIGLVDQLAEVHNETHSRAFTRLCNTFPNPFSGLCSTFRLIYGGKILKLLKEGQTADFVCLANNMCDGPADGKTCHLYPVPAALEKKSSSEIQDHIVKLRKDSPEFSVTGQKLDFCSIPLIGSIACSVLNTHAFSIEYPKDDNDKDGFSDAFTLRGSAWRGKDCKDKSSPTYPGRKASQNDLFADSNCNGISGKGLATQSYEEELCANTGEKGVIAIGDSVTANFHVPGQWFNATILDKELWKNLSSLMDNSFNWPQASMYTGYENVDWPIIDGTTDSIYLRMRERNLCNHRDYQNIGFNGARITDGPQYVQSIKRSPAQDKPVLGIFAYIGNDVCQYNPNPALDKATTPQQAREFLLESMVELNKKLPRGSQVFVVGVVDARPFFDGIRSQIHPFGAVRKDVTYLNFYDWLGCLGINPCPGYLTNDENMRNLTAQRVVEINAELERVVTENQLRFSNFEMIYMPNPIMEVLEKWTGETWELIEAFDGFHPNQKGHKLVAEIVWNRLVKDYPDVVGPVNPNNDRIRELFGDQGGH